MNGNPSDSGVADEEAGPPDMFTVWVERLNRLIRPILLIFILGILLWPAFQPGSASNWAFILKDYPEPLWVFIFIVIGSIASTKLIRDVRSRTTFFQTDTDYSNNGGMVNPAEAPKIALVANNTLPNPSLEAWKNRANQSTPPTPPQS